MLEDDEEDGASGGAPAWMATFADLMSLLLTFFVLLLSFAELDIIEFKTALGSVKDALGVITKRPGYLEASSTTPISFDEGHESERASTGIPQELVPIQQLIQKKKLDGTMKLIVTDKNIILRVHNLFRSGTALVEPANFEQLDIMTALCRLYPQPVMVEAHTDDQPIRSAEFPSNWELSAQRAAMVARYMVDAGNIDPTRVSPAGFAEHRPLVPNDGPAHRARNRRLDIILARRNEVPVQINDADAW
ncbi:MAG: OmpA family protein [Myxococcota bacterium]